MKGAGRGVEAEGGDPWLWSEFELEEITQLCEFYLRQLPFN
jgi:hypothetical protein